MMQISDFDWRKNAAAAAGAPDPTNTSNDQVERAFMETAYQSVANKAGMLMEPQHQLGFEIVSKNETNTRLLGVFAFRTGSELLYAPVFFLNGDIKGTDLLYRHRVKRFLPMDEKIVRRLVSLTKNELGGGVDRSFARRQPQALHVERIAYPPPTYKQASAETKAAFADMLTKFAFPTGVLADFMQNKGGSFALEKLAALMESVPEFGAACEARLTKAMLGIDGSPYPVDVAVETTLRGLSKRASAAEQRALRELAYQAAVANDIGNTKLAAAFFGEETLELRPAEAVLFDKSASASKRDEAASRGYDLLDKRRDLKPAIVDEVDRLTTLCRPGIHKVLDEKGDKVEVRAFVRSDRSLYDFIRSGEVTLAAHGCCGSSYDHAHDPDFYCFTTDAKAKMSQMLTGVDTLVAEVDSNKDVCDGLYTSEDIETGKVYMLVDNNEVFTEPFMLVSKATDDQGLVSLTVRRRWDSENETRLLRCNPDTKASVDGVLGCCARFIAIDTEPLPERRKDEPCSSRAFGDTKGFFVVGRKDLTAELRKSACRHAELRHDAGFFSLSIEGQAHGEAKRKQAAVALATRLALPADSAEELLTKAASAGSVKFWFHTEGKQAYAVRLMNEPVFREETDADFGVIRQPEQEWTIPTQQQRNYVPGDRIGDHANLQPEKPRNMEQEPQQLDTLPEEILLSAAPGQLASIGAELKVPKLFEVGVVGALASAYQSSAIIAKMLPKIEEAIDAMGRALFLFYWKPEDFKKAYGEDDLPQLEMELLSQFKATGDLWLKLSQATPDTDPLAAPLPL